MRKYSSHSYAHLGILKRQVCANKTDYRAGRLSPKIGRTCLKNCRRIFAGSKRSSRHPGRLRARTSARAEPRTPSVEASIGAAKIDWPRGGPFSTLTKNEFARSPSPPRSAFRLLFEPLADVSKSKKLTPEGTIPASRFTNIPGDAAAAADALSLRLFFPPSYIEWLPGQK